MKTQRTDDNFIIQDIASVVNSCPADYMYKYVESIGKMSFLWDYIAFCEYAQN